jgi:hypothetical protein
MLRVKVATYIFIAFLMGACVSVTPQLNQKSNIDPKQGILLGRSEIVHNGLVLTRDNRSGRSQKLGPFDIHFFPDGMLNEVSPFTTFGAVKENASLDGQWRFTTQVNEGDYFVVSLPPGTYYFFDFSFGGARALDVQSYVGHSLLSGIKSEMHPFVVTFDVTAGQVTYIGTMRHFFKDYRRGLLIWTLSIEDESHDADLWLHNAMPQLDLPMKIHLAEMSDLPETQEKAPELDTSQ